MAYVDGFVIPVPKSRLDDYKVMAQTGSEVVEGPRARLWPTSRPSATTCPTAR